ncbi:alpha/beta hydrolase family protein [Novosphingobium profundi]|uniref:alpha/beta hydrolase family protein n=1 Tax=Novosphingobium profundi TaxID=1774954 RepID=UPI001CFE793E|nr:prolyl oligopeptidase family serine peptidase [Novosphingobium profundi]
MEQLRTCGLALALAGLAAGWTPSSHAQPMQAPSAATAPAPLIPVSAFAARSQVFSATLAPDGAHIAMSVRVKDEVRVSLYDAATLAPLRSFAVGKDQDVDWLRWAGKDRLLISLSQPVPFYDTFVTISRVQSIHVRTGKVQRVGWDYDTYNASDVIHVDPDGRFLLMSLLATAYHAPQVLRFDLTSPEPEAPSQIIQGNSRDIWEWRVDDAGVVRLGYQWTTSNRRRMWYRGTPGEDLHMVDDRKEDERVEKPRSVLWIDPHSDMAVVAEPRDGFLILRRHDLRTGQSGEVVQAIAGHDLDRAFFDPVTGALSFVRYTDDTTRTVWLDPQMATLQANLEKAMPGKEVLITDLARDHSRMLVHIASADDPGALYVYTPARKELSFFANDRPELVDQPLARTRSVSYPARDGTAIHAYLTLPKGRAERDLPLIVLPHGGPYGVHDQLRYDDEVQFLANRGYAVLQPNYRGSDGYGEMFEELGRGQIGRGMQDDLDDGMDWLVAQGIADPARVCLVGSSYGGYAALWGVIRNPERYRCAASFAGVTEWASQFRHQRQYFSSRGKRRWRERLEGSEDGFRFEDVSPANQIARLTRPILVAHGKKDGRVPYSQFYLLEKATKQANVAMQTLIFEDEGHGFSEPENEARWYETLSAFLARHNPADEPSQRLARTP